MVVVDLLALREGQVRLRPVIVILLEQDAGPRGERLQDGRGDRRLAGPRATCDAEEEGTSGRWIGHARELLPRSFSPRRRGRATPATGCGYFMLVSQRSGRR